MAYFHDSVMLKEILNYLDPRPGKKYIDCTLGGAGYTIALAKEVGEQGQVIAIDLDELAIKNATRLIAQQKLENIVF